MKREMRLKVHDATSNAWSRAIEFLRENLNMLNQRKIDQQIDKVLAGPMPVMQALLLDPFHLQSSGEEYITICRGLKTEFDRAEHFWLKARQQREWWDTCEDGDGFGSEYENYKDYAASIMKLDEPLTYISLSAEEFYEFINLYPCFGPLRQPLSEILELDELKPSYISGARADANWNSRLVFAEFIHEFVAFHWRTTA